MAYMNKYIKFLCKPFADVIAHLFPIWWKETNELYYWKKVKRKEGNFTNTHYIEFYTTHFELSEQDYAGKCVLDIGCGPRGSLEWAVMAKRRIGLDPLADQYLALGADQHEMTYVCSPSEDMPFNDNDFDVVCSFNSLDHVSDLEKTLSEITRVTRPNGLFLLLTDVGHAPTACEPQFISWSIVDKLSPDWELLERRDFEKSVDGMYESIKNNVPYDHNNREQRYGILSAKFRRCN